MFADKIRKIKLSDYSSVDEAMIDIQKYATNIREIVKKAKVAGCHMENRLYQYHDALVGLGFVRKKRKKYTKK
jgi:hypothetical protein